MDKIFEEYTELVKRFKGGDEEAFTDLYERSQRLVYFTCLEILGNGEDAKDALQETYLTAYKKIATLDQENKFPGWIKKIAANKAYDIFRKKRDNISYEDAIASGEALEGDDDLESLPDSLIMEK
ncbi:MAG: sigma-70 family RNA polymerase sigma factor, partial [Clostridiales bacterium]|nr:sigma-70 family RNA polymerase sigma factor [Clostridiales bacterium]